jgi:predicted MFS family arabinose efflux permease
VSPDPDRSSPPWWRGVVGVLAGAFLFNLGQGVLRPMMPLYLQQVFSANYRMVTAIPTVFGLGKWIASLPTGHLLDRFGRRPLMIGGLMVIAFSDVASVMTTSYSVFLSFRALAGVGWAMFGTVATTVMVNVPAAQRRGRAVSLLMMSETSGLLVGTAAGGWAYVGAGLASPLILEAGCMLTAALLAARWALPPVPSGREERRPEDWRQLRAVLRTPGVAVMSLANAVLTAIQTGVLVFLFPLYLAIRGGVGPEAVGVLTSLSIVGRLGALWLGGGLSDRLGRTRVLFAGLIGYAAALGSVPLVTDPVWLGVWSFALGATAGFVAALPTAAVGDQTAPALHGLAIGWLRTITDSGQILGPLVMGGLADAAGLPAPFYLGAALLVTMAWPCRHHTSPAHVTAADGDGT